MPTPPPAKTKRGNNAEAGPSKRAKETSSYVSHGSYGCVLKPAMKCNDPSKNTVRNSIAKLFDNYTHYDAEVKFQERVKSIDPRGEFTVRIIEHCDIHKDAYPDTELVKCRSQLFDPDKVHQIVYPYGGVDLASLRNTSFEDVFAGLEPIFKGLCTLDAAKIVHRDIKPPNMLYCPQTKKCVLIDFGIMIPYAELYYWDETHRYRYVYDYYPPEFRFYAEVGLPTSSPKPQVSIADAIQQPNNTIKSFIEELTKNRQAFSRRILTAGVRLFNFEPSLSGAIEQLLWDDKTRVLPEVAKMTQLVPANMHGARVRDTFNTFAPKCDVYMLGTTIMEMLVKLGIQNQVDKNNIVFLKGVIKLVSDMTCMNPGDRYRPQQALQAYLALRHMIRPSNRSPPSTSPKNTTNTHTPPKKTHTSTPKKQSSPSVEIVGSVKGRTPPIVISTGGRHHSRGKKK